MKLKIKIKHVCKKALKFFGILPQSLKWCEELAELQKEICKATIKPDNKEQLIDEIADVKICIEQVKLAYVITDGEINDRINFKLDRLKNRINAMEKTNMCILPDGTKCNDCGVCE